MTGINTDGLNKRVWVGKLVRASADWPWDNLREGVVYRIARVWESRGRPRFSLHAHERRRDEWNEGGFEPEAEHIMAGSPWTFEDVAPGYDGPVHGETRQETRSMSDNSILPAAEWALCRVVPPGVTEGGIVIPEREGTHKLVLVQAAEGHYTAGTFVPFKAPVGSRLIPRPTAETLDLGALLAQHVLVHLRDVVGFIPPETH